MHFIPNILSTNALLKEKIQAGDLAGEPVENFFALYTNYQSQGRGMGSNRWFSDDGKNILVSFHFTPDIPAAEQFLFNQYFALVTAAFLERYVSNVEIKWPNDIYVRKQKIAGILIEHTIRGSRICHTIAGIGLNVNQEHFPADIPHPTSIFLETGKQYDPTELLKEYHTLLKEKFAMLQSGNAQQLREAYLQKLYQRGEYHNYLIRGEQVVARIVGLDAYGQLMLESQDGELYTCAFKEVVFLRNEQP